MKIFKFFKKEQEPTTNDIPIPEWITETSHRILYLRAYWDAHMGEPRLNDFRRGLSDMGMDIYDLGWFEYYKTRPAIPNERV